jgi:hypothetical protein
MRTIQYIAQQLVDPKPLPQPGADPDALAHFLTIFFTILGALAFFMLIIAGFRYVISSGEPQKTAEIRRQIIYIVIGLILAISADAIVNFVLKAAG